MSGHWFPPHASCFTVHLFLRCVSLARRDRRLGGGGGLLHFILARSLLKVLSIQLSDREIVILFLVAD